MMHIRFRDACRRAPSLAAAIGSLLLLPLLSAPPAFAALKGISVAPPEPGTCDSISITVAGELPDPCYEVVGATIRGPEQLPCMWPGPCPSRFWVEITVREPNPASDRTCPAVVAPYTRSFSVGKLPAGLYGVVARERIVPYSSDSTVSDSFVNTSFTVRPDPACSPSLGCYILSFGHSPPRPFPVPSCTATGPPGGIACLSISLMNTSAVAGLQTTIEVTNADGTPADPFIHAVSVDPIMRALGFQVGWTADGSRTKILLYSTTPGASIPPDAGPVLRICYSIARETQPQVFRVFDSATIVADQAGETIPPCPTMLLPIVPGTICVGSPGCDLNGDGFSDVLDVIRLVRCALAARNDSSEACPDSIAARADCNGDGLVDIRDVICCVRKIVETVVTFPNPSLPRPSFEVPTGESSIGFEGTARWSNAVEGIATVRIDADKDWGGTQFVINPTATPVRIRSLSLDDASARAGTQLEFVVNQLGIARVMLYETTPGSRPAHTYRILVRLERAPSGAGSEPLRIQGVLAGTSEGAEAAISTSNTRLVIDGAAVAAPALLGARPNPTSGATEIGFMLPTDARVTLHVYDVAGRLVRTLIDGPVPAGVQRARWDGKDRNGRAAVSGLYFAKLTVGATVRSERVLLLR